MDKTRNGDPSSSDGGRPGESSDARLTPRQRVFVAEFLVDRNATQAAIRAGYSAATAATQGPRLLQNVGIQTAVERGLRALEERLHVTAERIVQEIARVGLADIRDYMRWGPDGVELRPSEELTADQRAAIQEITETRSKGTVTTRVRLHAKVPALESLGKHLGLFTAERGQLNPGQIEAVLEGVAAIVAKYVPEDKAGAAITELTRIARDTYARKALPEPTAGW
jgi:phage terminase small subunit